MKRSLALLLAIMMLVPLTLCGASAEEKPTISYYATWCGALDPGSYVETYIEDKLGINLDIRKVSHTDTDAINLMLASGEMPDCGWFTISYEQMADDELIRSIPVDMVKEYAPSYIELCENNPTLYALSLDPDDPSQFRFLPSYGSSNGDWGNVLYIRYDWLENLGLDLGVDVKQVADQLYIAENGITLDKFTEVLRAFVNDDPDGNGQKDTYGLLKDWAIALLSSQGIAYGANADVDGVATDWFTNPAIKPLLNYMHDLYAEGLVYPEIFTIQWGEDWELINTSKAGVLAGNSVSTVWLNSWASSRPPLSLFAANSEATLVMVPGIVGEDGKVHQRKSPIPGGSEFFYINADVDDEKLAEILKFFEYCNFAQDDDVLATMWYGEKDVDWTWDGDKPVQLKVLENGEKGTQIFCRSIQQGKQYEWYTYEPLFLSGADYYVADHQGKWCDMLEYDYKVDIFGTTNASAISAEYSADWTAARDAYFMSVILGDADTEADWDAYITTLNQAHHDEYLEELTKAPSVEEILNMY